jgi:hypothetical protein
LAKCKSPVLKRLEKVTLGTPIMVIAIASLLMAHIMAPAIAVFPLTARMMQRSTTAYCIEYQDT